MYLLFLRNLCLYYLYILPTSLMLESVETDIFFFQSAFFFNFILFLNFTHCISFAKYQNESATVIHVFPILNPPPSSLPVPALWVVLYFSE